MPRFHLEIHTIPSLGAIWRARNPVSYLNFYSILQS